MIISAAAAEPTFSDVPTSHWAYVDVQRANALGIVNGIGNNKFNPDGTVTNAEFAAMITRAFYQGVVDGYINYFGESAVWWKPYIESAYAKCLLEGTKVLIPRNSGNYDWDETVTQPISRYDMAQIMYNTIVKEKATLPTTEEITAAQSKIGDLANIPAEYQTAVATCYASGLITGTDQGTFSGETNMNRAQAATVICRLLDYISK